MALKKVAFEMFSFFINIAPWGAILFLSTFLILFSITIFCENHAKVVLKKVDNISLHGVCFDVSMKKNFFHNYVCKYANEGSIILVHGKQVRTYNTRIR